MNDDAIVIVSHASRCYILGVRMTSLILFPEKIVRALAEVNVRVFVRICWMLVNVLMEVRACK